MIAWITMPPRVSSRISAPIAVTTSAGQLPARWIVHAVGPIWHGGDRGEADLLASAYRSSLDRAAEVEAALSGPRPSAEEAR